MLDCLLVVVLLSSRIVGFSICGVGTSHFSCLNLEECADGYERLYTIEVETESGMFAWVCVQIKLNKLIIQKKRLTGLYAHVDCVQVYRPRFHS